MNGPDSRWRLLLERALPALRHVFGMEDASAPARWTLGGGTALAVWVDHRTSFDIDLFVPTVPLRAFTPAANPAAASISENYQWPGHDLKYETPDGEIDFLSPHLQTDPGYAWTRVGDHMIPLETPEEIVIKKLRYRSAALTARDVFDIAAAAQAGPGLADVLAEFVPDALARAIEALDFLAGRGPDLSGIVLATEAGRPLLTTAFDITGTALAEAAGRARDRPGGKTR